MTENGNLLGTIGSSLKINFNIFKSTESKMRSMNLFKYEVIPLFSTEKGSNFRSNKKQHSSLFQPGKGTHFGECHPVAWVSMPWGRWDAPERGTCGLGCYQFQREMCIEWIRSTARIEAQEIHRTRSPTFSNGKNRSKGPYRWFLGPLGFNQAAWKPSYVPIFFPSRDSFFRSFFFPSFLCLCLLFI